MEEPPVGEVSKHTCVSAFGFDTQTNDYKVFQAAQYDELSDQEDEQ